MNMKKNDFSSVRQKNTENFLRSYQIQLQMRSVSGFDEKQNMETADSVELSQCNPYDKDLKCGQIRLLSGVKHITYVVLLRRWEHDSFVVMTFSHYDFPATDEEFTPQFNGGIYLNTLQTWNTRTLQDESLKKSWLIGDMPEADCTDAWNFWEHLIAGNSIEDRILTKTGIPITDEHDIRIQYIQEELDVFQNIDSADLKEDGGERQAPVAWWNQIAIPSLWEPEEAALAAGSEQHNIFIECHPAGYKEIAAVEYAPREKALRLKIRISDGQQFSMTFENWDLVDSSGVTIGKITDGKCIVRDFEYSAEKIALRDPSGNIVVFEKIQENH